MTRQKLLLIGLISSILFGGIAYAAWTTSVDVNINAKSGELDIEIAHTEILAVDEYVIFEDNSIIVSEDKKMVTISIDNMYPGAEANFALNVQNIGTIPVSLDMITHSILSIVDTKTNEKVNKENDLLDNFIVEYTISKVDSNGEEVDKQNSITAVNKEWSQDIYIDNNLSVILPEEFLKITVGVYIDIAADDNSQNKMFKFLISPLFSQDSDLGNQSFDMATPLGNSFEEITDGFEGVMNSYYQQNGRYPRSWGEYAYTDIGLNEDDWGEAVDHIVYRPIGNRYGISPEEGYKMIINSPSGEQLIIKERYNWDILYDLSSDEWYFKSVSPENIVEIDSLQVIEDD